MREFVGVTGVVGALETCSKSWVDQGVAGEGTLL